MPPRGLPVGLVLGLLLSTLILAACTGAAAPTTGSGSTQGQGGGGAAATTATGQGTSGAEGGGAVTLPNPCSLLTTDEIKAQFTFDVAPGIASSKNAGATSPDCNWNPVDHRPTFGGVQLIVEKFDQGCFDFRKGPKSVDVAGVGVAAYFIQPTNPYTLLMKQSNRRFTLTVQAGSGSSDSPGALQQKVINLANNILGHM
jgi:hypothetical protein